MTNTNDPALTLQNIASTLRDHQIEAARNILNTEYPFTGEPAKKRNFSESAKFDIFLRDGFIDRYSGKKLIFVGILRILSHVFPQDFPYHKNGKMDRCHIAYWELIPTLDHVVPVSRGGADEATNMVTTSMLSNARKANWTLEELEWELKPAGDLQQWDGLTSVFMQLVDADKSLLEQDFIRKHHSLVKNALARHLKHRN